MREYGPLNRLVVVMLSGKNGLFTLMRQMERDLRSQLCTVCPVLVSVYIELIMAGKLIPSQPG